MTADRPRRAKAGRNQQKVQRLPSVSSDDESSDENSVTRCICHKIHNDGMMVQCDNCNVWQHCPCVGLAGITEDEMPDQYYCEECKPENHVVADSYGKYRRVYDPKGNHLKGNKKRTTMNSADATDSIPELFHMLSSETNGYTREPTSPSMTSETLNPSSFEADEPLGSRVSKRRRSTTSTSETLRSTQATKRDTTKQSRSTSPTARKQPMEDSKSVRGNKRRTAASDKSIKTRVSASPQMSFKELPTDGVSTRRRGGQWRNGSPDTRAKSNEPDMDGGENEQENETHPTNGKRRGIGATSNSPRAKKSELGRRRGKGTIPSPLSPNLDRHVPTKHSPLIGHREDMDMKTRTPLSPFEERLSDTESPRVRAKTPPTKVRYPSNKMSLGDMDKRASQILRYINRMQMTLTKKQRTRQALDHNHQHHHPHQANQDSEQGVVVDSVVIPKDCTNTVGGNNKLVGELEVANPAPVLQRSLSVSSVASSLSSASTIPLNDDDSKSKSEGKATSSTEVTSTAPDEEDEKSCIPAPGQATAIDIMSRLACELVKFQYRFGPQRPSTNAQNHQPPADRHNTDDLLPPIGL
ncbi:Histone deacetylase complex subunit [Umbelopsis sp. WA50703]